MKVIMFLDIFSPLLALIFFFLKRKKATGEKIILIFLMFEVAINSYSKYLFFFAPTNIFVYQINAFVSYIILCIYFFVEFRRIFSLEFIFLDVVSFVLVFTILIVIQLKEDVSVFNSISYSVVALFISVKCLIYYLYLFRNPSEIELLSLPIFWIVSALFIYFGINFFLFFTLRVLTMNQAKNIGLIWSFHNVLFFVMAIMLCKSTKC
jgi:hypothetical protein